MIERYQPKGVVRRDLNQWPDALQVGSLCVIGGFRNLPGNSARSNGPEEIPVAQQDQSAQEAFCLGIFPLIR